MIIRITGRETLADIFNSIASKPSELIAVKHEVDPGSFRNKVVIAFRDSVYTYETRIAQDVMTLKLVSEDDFAIINTRFEMLQNSKYDARGYHIDSSSIQGFSKDPLTAKEQDIGYYHEAPMSSTQPVKK